MVQSDPPGGEFGPSPRTQTLRPEIQLNNEQIDQARRMRKEGSGEQEIASHFGVSIEEVQLALAGLRTPVPFHRRRTVNVGVNAYRELVHEQRPDEAMWETMDRLLTELHDRRRAGG